VKLSLTKARRRSMASVATSCHLPALDEPHREGTTKMTDTMQSIEDLAILEQLNKDFFHSDQFSDVKRFGEFLAEDFISQFPGVTRNRAEFLEYIAKGTLLNY
jgi:hypothetical protein